MLQPQHGPMGVPQPHCVVAELQHRRVVVPLQRAARMERVVRLVPLGRATQLLSPAEQLVVIPAEDPVAGPVVVGNCDWQAVEWLLPQPV